MQFQKKRKNANRLMLNKGVMMLGAEANIGCFIFQA
jgi:hypothetical protein|tara:strand:+ start:420 stop:527 length:108 start_codon:yes stop_codon:yes gene_type:complete